MPEAIETLKSSDKAITDNYDLIWKAVKKFRNLPAYLSEDDLFQAACEAIYREYSERREYDSKNSAGLIYTIATHACIHELKALSWKRFGAERQGRVLVGPRDPHIIEEEDVTCSEDEYGILDSIDDIFFGGLTEMQKKIVLLRYVGLTPTEIARFMDVDPQTIRGYLDNIAFKTRYYFRKPVTQKRTIWSATQQRYISITDKYSPTPLD